MQRFWKNKNYPLIASYVSYDILKAKKKKCCNPLNCPYIAQLPRFEQGGFRNWVKLLKEGKKRDSLSLSPSPLFQPQNLQEVSRIITEHNALVDESSLCVLLFFFFNFALFQLTFGWFLFRLQVPSGQSPSAGHGCSGAGAPAVESSTMPRNHGSSHLGRNALRIRRWARCCRRATGCWTAVGCSARRRRRNCWKSWPTGTITGELNGGKVRYQASPLNWLWLEYSLKETHGCCWLMPIHKNPFLSPSPVTRQRWAWRSASVVYCCCWTCSSLRESTTSVTGPAGGRPNWVGWQRALEVAAAAAVAVAPVPAAMEHRATTRTRQVSWDESSELKSALLFCGLDSQTDSQSVSLKGGWFWVFGIWLQLQACVGRRFIYLRTELKLQLDQGT